MKCDLNKGPSVLLRIICTLVFALGFVYPVNAQRQYDYVATTTEGSAAKQRSVNAGSLEWVCAGYECRIRGPWPIPSVNACRALAKEVGFIQSYGHPGRYLNQAELNRCNEGILLQSPIKQRAVISDDFKPLASSPPISPDRITVLPKAKPPGSIIGTPQDLAKAKLQAIPFDLAIEAVSKKEKYRYVTLRVGDKVPVQVSVRNHHGFAPPVTIGTTSDRTVLKQSTAQQIPADTRVDIPLEMYINPQHVHDGTFKAYVWLGTSDKAYVYRDASRANNIHEVVWSVAPRPSSNRRGFTPPVVGGRSASDSSCDVASLDTPCQVQPTECIGRGADWKVAGTYQCHRGELQCVARVAEDYCVTCGGACGACTSMSCSSTNLCAPGSICVDNPELTPRPTCKNLNDDYVARLRGRRVCTHIAGFCWTPDEVGQPEINCREAQ